MGKIEDSLKQGIERGVEDPTVKETNDLVNRGSYALIKQFFTKALNGQIEINDTADLLRIYQVWDRALGVNEKAEGSGGTLPSLSLDETDMLNDSVKTRKEINEDGEEETYVDDSDMLDMDDDDVDKLINDRLNALNKKNTPEDEEKLS